jgi:hypothetical protein
VPVPVADCLGASCPWVQVLSGVEPNQRGTWFTGRCDVSAWRAGGMLLPAGYFARLLQTGAHLFWWLLFVAAHPPFLAGT